MKILFLARSLDFGGAERQLVVLAKGLRERGHDVVVAMFYSGGPLEKDLLEAGIPLRPLGKRGRWDVAHFLCRLVQVVREERPHILHSYLTDLPTLALKPFFPEIKVVWAIRSSDMDMRQYDWLMRWSFKLACWLSGFADRIIANSRAGRDYHVGWGYLPEKIVTIPNGIDTQRFRPVLEARRRIRLEWGIRDDEQLIGMVARLDPMKDHRTFLSAAALLVQKRKNLRFLCVGDGPADYRVSLWDYAKALGLSEYVIWAGARADVADIYCALDLHVSSSSFGEGFPNVLGEAMACGVSCIATNVGDSAWVVGATGKVVPPRDPVALQNAIEQLLDRKSSDPEAIRQRIVEQFSVETLVVNTERALSDVSHGMPAPRTIREGNMEVNGIREQGIQSQKTSL